MVIVHKEAYPIESVCNEHFARYSHVLSDFQKHAIDGIAKGDHVLVTAHTGSGKTLPAEFAIEHLVSQGKKVIYTSPIKALSNQKFYEFCNKFPHISFGLFTGDIKTNPEADVLIMTTEILMNRLFNYTEDTQTLMQFQMDFETELGAVVFDEVHYINDTDRGQVWEKAIIMLPDHIQMIMLSATIDKPERFAKWIESNHNGKQVHVCPTNHRVVPLSHYGYMAVGDHEFKQIRDKSVQQQLRKQTNKPILLKDAKGKVIVENMNVLKRVQEQLDKQKARINRKFVLNNLAKHLRDNNMLPAICFVFSRKNVESCAKELTTPLLEKDSKIPYLVEKESMQILRRLPNYEEYLRLPEYIELVALLEKGIGIHHSGMIPILREIVELFISKKIIKILFATESFAIGLDCPIKTTVFTGIKKFDGDYDRYLMPHEYTQMAGRAGRRGIDTVGYVIHCNNLFRKTPTENEYKTLMSGKPPSFISKFKLDYSLVLNVLKSEPESTIDEISKFIGKSMMNEDLVFEIKELEDEINAKKYIHTQKMNTLELSKTPKDICLKYKDLGELLKNCQSKKRKNISKEMKDLEENFENIQKDLGKIQEVMDMKKPIEKMENNLERLESYIKDQVVRICGFLESEGFLTIDDNLITATHNGSICSHIAEVHGPIWIKCMIDKWNYFEEFNAKQLVGLFSCATAVKVKEDFATSIPQTESEFLKTKILEMKDMYVMYDTEEGNRDIRTSIRYDDSFTYSIIEESMLWCDCKNEEECKKFISEKLSVKGISLGDFTKAILKIVTIAKEMRGLYELEYCSSQTEWVHKLTQIEDMVLKYIATNQSLYV